MATKRKPLALTNWKMKMTIAESVDFVKTFTARCRGEWEPPYSVDVVVCPPFTALHAVGKWLENEKYPVLQLGAQNMHWAQEGAYTGEISAHLLRDVGCQWVMLGHWERRRMFGETDETVNRKVLSAIAAELRPIILVGEATEARAYFTTALQEQLTNVLKHCNAAQIVQMAFVYEPEWTIGAKEPASAERVGAGSAFIRQWLARQYGDEIAQRVRIIYGGSVAPEYAAELLAQPDVDGLGATRKGRDPHTWWGIVHAIATARE